MKRFVSILLTMCILLSSLSALGACAGAEKPSVVPSGGEEKPSVVPSGSEEKPDPGVVNGDAGKTESDGGLDDGYYPEEPLPPVAGDVYYDSSYLPEKAPATGLPPTSDSVIEGGSDYDDGGTGDNVTLPSGMITAGAWNDNDYYQMWLDLFAQGDEKNGKFYEYTMPENSWGYNSLNRVDVSVKSGGNASAGALVYAKDEQGIVLYSAVTDAQGMAYLFPEAESGIIEVVGEGETATAEFASDTRSIELELNNSTNKLNVIEIMFVVDVTGSMGDEISFLKAELADVINKIAANDSETVIKLALLFYRDKEDRIPFDYYDFTDVTTPEGLATQQQALDSQRASGGGDYPEAVDEALEMAVSKQWSTGATTKIIYHVLDAPAHEGAEYAERLVNATNSAAEKGIRICPIICSGAAESTEYTMREAAIYTGGTFIYVTDDSGIGGSHHDPEIPNATIELLNSMLVRLTKGYHTGKFSDAVYWKDDK